MPNLKVEPREGIFYAVGTIAGKRIRESLKTRDREQADELCALLEARHWERAKYGEAKVRTFEEAAVSYMTQGGEGRFLNPVIRHFKGRMLASITPGEVRAMALKLYPNATAATRNRQAIVPARAVIRHAHSLGWCGSMSVELFPVPKSRKHKPVNKDWLATFVAQADKDKLPHLSALVLFMNRTATRVSEALRVTGADVNVDKRTVVLGKTKEGEDEVRFLTADVLVRIVALNAGPDDRVFSYTDRCAVNRRIASVCERAGIESRTSHSVGRHSYATNAMALGSKVKDAMDGGGWKTARLFMETYVHSDDAGRSVAEKFDREHGPIDANMAQGLKRKRNRFGKSR